MSIAHSRYIVGVPSRRICYQGRSKFLAWFSWAVNRKYGAVAFDLRSWAVTPSYWLRGETPGPGFFSSVINPPAPEPGWITIGAKNDVVPPGHWFYLFHVVPSQLDKPFCFEESVGGGHTSGGGAIQLGLLELDEWPGEWRKHVAKAGCPWVAEIIDTRLSNDVQDLIAAILARHNR